MRFGIIGAGKIGGTLARRLTALGHEVSIANSRGPETLAALARETGAKPVTVEEAARAGDVVIVSIPVKNISRLPAGLFEGVAKDVVVVDTGNYYPQQRDGRIDPIENGATESRNASLCLWRATTAEPKRPSSGCSMSLGSTGWTPADWMSPGDSSPAPRSTAPTSMPRACAAGLPRRSAADGQPWRRFGCLRP
jgi:hypothetical protein